MNQRGLSDRRLSQMAGFAVFFALVVIGLGAFTRLIDAGLGCPDWPGCYGHILPSAGHGTAMAWSGSSLMAYKAWAEMIHRYAVGVLSLLIAASVLRIFFCKRLHSRRYLLPAMGLLLVLGYQIMLGQWTVTLKLWPIIVTQHLLGGFLILTLLWVIFLRAADFLGDNSRQSRGLFLGGLVVLLALCVQIALGAWTSTNYASLSCPDFPFCVNGASPLHYHFTKAFHLLPVGQNFEGGVLPEALRQTIQMTHRLGALLVTLMLGLLVVVTLGRPVSAVTKPALVLAALLPLQIALGIMNVLFQLPVAVAVCHTLVAALLLLALITLIMRACP